LSSGFFGFFAHAGMLAAVRELGITPAGYSGSSAGAIVAAMGACGMSDAHIREVLFGLKKSDFWDPDPPHRLLKNALQGLRGYAGYLKGRGFERLLEALPKRCIEECETPLVIAATDLTLHREVLFSEGDLIRALHASGAVPGLFKPVRAGDSWCVDGGMVDKAPVRALADRINPSRIIVHYLSSGNMAHRPDTFLHKRFTPVHIYQLSVNIGRHVSYEHQCDLLRQQGIEIVEVRSHPPSVGPGRLSIGPAAYEHARRAALDALAHYQS
jgi:NTE family protein